jgi:glycosyltransferase involved in cell wall biosynthesis
MIRESPQIPALLRPVGGMYGNYMLNKNIKTSKKITVTTDNLKKDCRIPEDKVEIIPNGVDTNIFKDYGEKTKDELGLDGFIIGYVGVLREWIDFEPVFAALKELDKEIKMVIVGKEGRYKENIELAKSYGISERVIFTGMVPYSKVPKYISAMDICLMPFKKMLISENAVPLKLFEYMACERPIISTRLSGIEKVAKNKIFYASTKEEYIHVINELFRDEDLRKKSGLNLRAFVENEYEWSTISNKLEKIMIGI